MTGDWKEDWELKVFQKVKWHAGEENSIPFRGLRFRGAGVRPTKWGGGSGGGRRHS